MYRNIKTSREMSKKNEIAVKDVLIRTMTKDGIDYICIQILRVRRILLSPKMLLRTG